MGNSNSKTRFDPSKEPTAEQLRYLENLPAHHKALIREAVEDDLQIAKTIIMKKAGFYHDDNPTKWQINLAVRDCYTQITRNRADENYIYAVIQAIVYEWGNADEVDKNDHRNAMENLITLASRMVKGEKCTVCNDDEPSPLRGSETIHQHFADAMLQLVDDYPDPPLNIDLGDKSKFALTKLCEIHPETYRWVKYLTKGRGPEWEGYETMWCGYDIKGGVYNFDDEDRDDYVRTCDCWDQDYGPEHEKYCPFADH
jgi:hypothetical protein